MQSIFHPIVNRIGLALLIASLSAGCGSGTARSDAHRRGDTDSAARLYDDAIRLELQGDALGAEEILLRIAAEHPDTRHGEAAARKLGSSNAMVVVAVIGVLAAVAVPAFMKYIRRSKTSEATMNLRRLYDGAVVYFMQERYGADGKVLPRRFPQSTPKTPQRSACVDGESVEHVPDSEEWSAPGWQELGFSIHESHFFQYEFISSGEGPTASFTARAVGDLDCNGAYSLFERTGTVGPEGEVSGGAGLYARDELE